MRRGPQEDGPAGGATTGGRSGQRCLAAEEQLVRDVLARVVSGPVDTLDDAALLRELGAIELLVRRLDARRCRLASALAERRAERARQGARAGRTDEQRAADRARRATQQELSDELGWSPSDAKQAIGMGKQLGGDGPAADAFDEGRLSARHAKLLADTLRWLDNDQREQAEAELLAQASELDAVAFGRACRRLLARLDHEAAARAEQRRHQRRRAAVAPTEDGMLALTGRFSGLDAETVATAVMAFRTADPPGIRRTAEQATADAIVELCRTALRAGEAPTRHGVRPQVSVSVVLDDHHAGRGVAETTWVGPLPYAEVRRLLDDCQLCHILRDRDGLPLAVTDTVRTVPAGLWRALVDRDGGCIADGCDTPASWCDVMHIGVPHHAGGRLSLETAALGCRPHHRSYDLHGWQIRWERRRPVLRPPPAPP